ncbi:MAG: tetratricopeptide repeat protein [Planctomycetota bacterium]
MGPAWWLPVAGLAVLGLSSSCGTPGPSAYAPLEERSRNPTEAAALTGQALEFIGSDPQEAETLLREALSKDLYHGPAHNNLGVIYLQQGKLYEAANAFEWARKLMPGHPDPRLNLGLTLERAGRLDEALETYETALEVYSEHIATMQAIARLMVRNGRADERLPSLLQAIAERGESEEWRSWAREQIARRGQS